jgi:excinuclease ABC subunit B
MTARYLKKKSKLSKKDQASYIADLEKEMKQAAKELDFERAASLRDMIFELKGAN